MIPTINPWKGLQPYIDSEDDLRLHPFCGRENVIHEVFELIDNNIVTTLYGKSGIGKTSLFNAGLFPKLREEDYIPVYVRLGTDRLANESFAECIIRVINAYTQNLDNRVNGIEMPDSCQNDYLWAYFASHSFYTKDGYVKFPVIVLDQFEEIFNEDIESVKQLLLQLQELTSDKLLPDGNTFVINFRIAISIREDDLYLLEDSIDSYYITELKANRYRLKSLSEKEAIRVIEVRDSSNKSLGRCVFEEDHFSNIANEIINLSKGNDANAGINTQILSLCCFLLYNCCSTSHNLIEISDVHDLKGNLIGTFYDEATKNLTDNQRKIFEEKLVTDNNRRLAWSKKNFRETICNCIDNPQKESEYFTGEYAILRKVITHGEECVELIHDMLASVVAERKIHRKNRERNKRRRLSKMNVLSPEGRRLIDNALEFDPDFDKLGNDDKFFLDGYMKFNSMLSDIIERRTGNSSFTTSSNISLQRVFDDSQLHDATIRLEFLNNDGEHVYTSDGIYIIDVKYSDNKIAEILFFDFVETLTELNAIMPVYINGGFCGIRIEYNDDQEIKRTYLQWDGQHYLPTTTTGGYASIEFCDFDKYGNPTKITYKDVFGNPCKHINGNYGFISEYDEDGFEVRRIFIDNNNKYASIISGVVARDLFYNKETGMLSREINLDSRLSPIKDDRGYCAADFKRDIKGRIIEERYYNELGKPCLSKDGYAIERNEYCDCANESYSITSFYDCNGTQIMHPDGYWKTRLNYDSLGYPIGMTPLDNEHNPVYLVKDEWQEMQFNYDERHWLVGMKIIGKNGTYKMGIWLEYNSTFTHIARMGYLSSDNKRTLFPDSTAYAVEARESSLNSDLPLLRVHLDENNRPIITATGYYASRLWEEKNKNWFDESDRTTKEMYYDLDGEPMADQFGVYGKRYEYNDNLLIKNEINLDSNGKDMDSINGICRIEQLFDSNGKEIRRLFFDKNGNRCSNPEGISMIRFEWTKDYHILTSIYYNQEGNPSDKELSYAYKIEEMDMVFPSKVHRRYYKNANQEIVVVDEVFYIVEFLYDKEGNTIEIRNVGPDGNLLNRQDGFAILRTETINSTDGQIRKELYLDENSRLVIPDNMNYAISMKCYDKNGRIVKERFLDADEKLVEYNDGTYGATYEYGSIGNTIIQCNINENGQVMSDNEGIAKHLIELDNKGQKVKEIYYDLKGNAILTNDEDYGKRWRYCDSLDSRTEAVESLDENEELKLNKWGYAVVERCFDKVGHLLSESFYDENQLPVKCDKQYHCARHDYSEDFSEKEISYYDTDGAICEDSRGISHVFQKLESNGRVIFEYRSNQKDEMVPYEDTTYIVKKDYLSDKEWKEYYLNQDGKLCDDSNGVACLHFCKDDNDRIIFQMRYNSEGHPVEDQWGDCGEMTVYYDSQHAQKVTSLDSDGNPHVNRLGFVSHNISRIGNKTRTIFMDANDTPTANIYGEFGQDVEQIDECTIITTSIDDDQKPMIPNNHGYATEIKTLDDNGRDKRMFWFSPDGSPYINPDGDSGLEFIYLEDGRQITKFLNKDGNLHINNRGYAQRLVEFDENGNEKSVLWLDVDSMPIANDNGDFGIMVAHDDTPNCILRAYLDKYGNPHKNIEGWTYRKEISLDGSNMEYHHYNIDMNPVEDQDGDVAYRKEINEEGIISYISLDISGNLHNNKRGFAKRDVVLDDKERIIKERWYKEDGSPFIDSNGDYGIVTIYEDEHRAKTQVFLDSDEKPRTCEGRPYYAIKSFKDDLGRDVKLLYLDSNLQPFMIPDGIYGKVTEYKEDSLFTFVETNIDGTGKPCKNSSGFVKKYVRSDDSGRPVLVVFTDGNDKVLTDSLGDQASGYVYTSDRDVLIVDSLDADYNPHINKLGYSREIRLRLSEYEYKSVYLDLQGNTVELKKKSIGITNILSKLFK